MPELLDNYSLDRWEEPKEISMQITGYSNDSAFKLVSKYLLWMGWGGLVKNSKLFLLSRSADSILS